ncbi:MULTISPECIES: glycine--tRNA ligase subunit beta [unclassified Brevundimonas]|uniref:glycine--tRNA ligase subunit beta n=1 Tax=unclassified Brevundimonas TaxID=2622653 RepID=UPI0006F43849|nr:MULTISPECIES: glycine--tRNA ligase subunit beta [unclassified Brevundimonas]KQY70201.1 glycine--tRNA ligase subunit beta [Brevundimonas sp. Root1423]KRA28911.1 glycine--tRNA ligase subunit beta [Brevundimonas sp. Root608]
MAQLLLELFSEEIPARMQQGAARDLERMAAERLKAAGLTYEALTTFAGPRRLTLVVEGLPAATPDREEELKGPRTSAPEQALDGFLRKTGLTKDQLSERDGVWFAVLSQKGRATTVLIPEMVDGIVRGFPWPKSMRWGSGTLRWIRPLKRITALFDGHVVPFEIDGIQSGDLTEGHRFLGCGRPFAVRDFADYRAKLESDFVLLDVVDRKLRILEGAQAACAARGLALVDDDGLLDEVAGLAEWPTPILGDMDPQFLTLPPEVIRLSMKVHQKYFAVRDPATHGLAPHFVVVANVEATDGGKALSAGNSRVLSARLDDARFFWDEDLKTGFDAWLKKLEGVTFHARLGKLSDRVDRIAALARGIAPLIGADPDQADQAARLAKADLSSGMVGEFPELQGVMGGYYARAFDHPDVVADAVRDHYKPQGPADSVPTAPLTVAVALAEKLDTLVGFFAIDEKPTGSKDPYALRRAALGVIRLILENGIRVELTDLYRNSLPWIVFWGAEASLSKGDEKSSTSIPTKFVNDSVLKNVLHDLQKHGRLTPSIEAELVEDFRKQNEAVKSHVLGLWKHLDDGFALRIGKQRTTPDEILSGWLTFFADRLKVLLRDQGKRHDLVDAVFALGDDDLVRIVRRVEALDAFLATEDGANLLAGYKRASNILKAEEKKGPLPEGMVNTGLPNQPEAETTLAFAVAAASTAVDAALETEDFAAAMTALSRLRAPVDAFFDTVMVNSDVAAERDNRLKLLGQVRAVMGRVADFGQIAG